MESILKLIDSKLYLFKASIISLFIK